MLGASALRKCCRWGIPFLIGMLCLVAHAAPDTADAARRLPLRRVDSAGVRWGAPVGGLRLGVGTCGENVVLQLQNVGDTALHVMSHVMGIGLDYDWFGIALENERGERRMLALVKDRDRSAPLRVELAAGESLRHVIDVKWWTEHQPNNGGPLAHGRYKVFLTYQVEGAYYNAWLGRLDAGPAELIIHEKLDSIPGHRDTAPVDSSNVVWGRAVNGLRLGVGTRGEHVVFRLQNVGDTALVVMSHVLGYGPTADLDWFGLVLENAGGRRRGFTLMNERDESAPISVRLAPGGFLEHVVDVKWWAQRDWNREGALAPGRYKVFLVYQVDDDYLHPWRGRLEAGPAELVINPKPVPDGPAADSIHILWGAPVKGLRLGIGSAADSVVFQLQNVGTVPLMVMSYVNAGEQHFDWYDLTLVDARGAPRAIVLMNDRDKAVPIRVELAPGEVLRHSVNVRWWAQYGWNTGGALAPGRYTVRMTYQVGEDYSYECWHGRIEAGPGEVVVGE